MTTKIFLLRHGITLANLENRFAGRSDEPLHPEGISQIKELGARLREEKIGSIYAGPLTRTRQTAELLSAMLGVPHASMDDFNEIDIPHWDGLTKDEIREQFGPEYPAWLDSPADFRLAGCETLSAVQERAVQGIEKIIANSSEENALIVSHLIVIRSLILHYYDLPLTQFRSITVKNGALISLERKSDGETIVLNIKEHV